MRRLSFPMRRRSQLVLSLAALIVIAAAFVARKAVDRRPNYAAAALPAPGALVPRFRLPMLGGDTIASETHRGRPAVYALWSLDCGVSRAALAGIEQLRLDYEARGVAVVLLADDSDTTALRHAMREAGVALPVAYANGRLKRLFDNARHAPERNRYRISFALPSFVVVDANGRVIHREAGIPFEEMRTKRVQLTNVRAALDSIVSRSATSTLPLPNRPARQAPHAAHADP